MESERVNSASSDAGRSRGRVQVHVYLWHGEYDSLEWNIMLGNGAWQVSG